MSEMINDTPFDATELPENRREYSSGGDDIIEIYFHDASRHPILTREEEGELGKAIEAGLYANKLLELLADPNNTELDKSEQNPEIVADLRTKVSNIRALPKADREELVHDLREIDRQGVDAKRLFVSNNLRLVISIALKYQGKGLDLADLIQEGNLVLPRAVEKFDYARGNKFSTYATWWIRQALQRAIGDQGRTIRIPIHQHEIINKLKRVTMEYTLALNREPTKLELAEAMGMEVETIEGLRFQAASMLSLNELSFSADGRGLELGDTISEGEAVSDTVVVRHLREKLEVALSSLDEIDASILKMRFGFYGQPRSYKDISEACGLSDHFVRKSVRTSLEQFRELSSPFFESMFDLYAS